ncbi:MAPEG family protein [Halorhodospira halochloris]|uniref:Probable membrane protein NMA1176 n=1 Tax=Halorhodospira halochloris TaxID=1052 RepID=A0A120MZC6_HALHR|nr:MAPEG family protein [Halorhodospira halochloris]MBK1650681.1 hypothetical protein [Halorhodospira halochloris]MCG5529790.1 MAPEG family protein [Halorhodospira halochloris]MCG5548959.1 MAPEG family protein [Halorhodospira halochloris]BAU56831.1 probable membrane protein NMA1176 [Halorhodospira halochloris]
MTLAHTMVLLAIFIPIGFAAAAKIGAGKFDNTRPRENLERLEGWPQRSHWAQQNGYEAFPPFAAAVLVAHQVGAQQEWVDVLAVLFVVLRIVYGLFYIADLSAWRSAAWAGAFFCIIGLFLLAAQA